MVAPLLIDSGSGLVAGADFRPSPNCDPRPQAVEIDLAVIHGISLPPGRFGGDAIERLFQNRLDPRAHPFFRQLEGLEVSSHLLIRRDGALQQFVPLHRRAWHAGKSSFDGRERCNDFSIGIELEGTDQQPYEEAQYRVLLPLLLGLMERYPAIDVDRVVGHSDIAPGRKSDPGPCFDWQRLRRELQQSRSAP